MTPSKTITADSPSFLAFVSPLAMFADLIGRRELIKQFAWREFEGRYKGTYLGILWSLLNPLMSLGVYYFVFGIILKARFTTASAAGEESFALTLFCGIIIFNVFSVCVANSPLSIADKVTFIKKVIFPLEVFPVAVLGASLLSAALGLAILIPALLLFTSHLSPTICLFPLVLIPLCALSLGISWFLASAGVVFRDLGQIVSIALQLVFFLSPVIYPLSAVPESFQLVMRLNPLTTILEDARRTLLWGQSIDFVWWGPVTLVSLIVMQLGYIWFMRVKRIFGDVA